MEQAEAIRALQGVLGHLQAHANEMVDSEVCGGLHSVRKFFSLLQWWTILTYYSRVTYDFDTITTHYVHNWHCDLIAMCMVTDENCNHNENFNIASWDLILALQPLATH